MCEQQKVRSLYFVLGHPFLFWALHVNRNIDKILNLSNKQRKYLSSTCCVAHERLGNKPRKNTVSLLWNQSPGKGDRRKWINHNARLKMINRCMYWILQEIAKRMSNLSEWRKEQNTEIKLCIRVKWYDLYWGWGSSCNLTRPSVTRLLEGRTGQMREPKVRFYNARLPTLWLLGPCIHNSEINLLVMYAKDNHLVHLFVLQKYKRSFQFSLFLSGCDIP